MLSLILPIITAELIIFYLLAQRLNQTIFLFFYLVTRSERVAFFIVTLLFFPGTVVHELAHLFTAEILGVKTGKLSLIPKRINYREIEAGSVHVAKADPFRMTIIGFAPIFWGIASIVILSLLMQSMHSGACFQIDLLKVTPKILQLDCRLPALGTIFIFYLLFSISTNMFSSREDVKETLPVLIVIGIISLSLYIAGVRIYLPERVTEVMSHLLVSIAQYLGIVLAVNTVIFIIVSIAIAFFLPNHR